MEDWDKIPRCAMDSLEDCKSVVQFCRLAVLLSTKSWAASCRGLEECKTSRAQTAPADHHNNRESNGVPRTALLIAPTLALG